MCLLPSCMLPAHFLLRKMCCTTCGSALPATELLMHVVFCCSQGGYSATLLKSCQLLLCRRMPLQPSKGG